MTERRPDPAQHRAVAPNAGLLSSVKLSLLGLFANQSDPPAPDGRWSDRWASRTLSDTQEDLIIELSCVPAPGLCVPYGLDADVAATLDNLYQVGQEETIDVAASELLETLNEGINPDGKECPATPGQLMASLARLSGTQYELVITRQRSGEQASCRFRYLEAFDRHGDRLILTLAPLIQNRLLSGDDWVYTPGSLRRAHPLATQETRGLIRMLQNLRNGNDPVVSVALNDEARYLRLLPRNDQEGEAPTTVRLLS